MKKLRVLILTHESLVPPDALDGHSQQEIDEWQTEYDVMSCLRQAGHEVQVLGLYDNLGDLRARITDWQPDVTFNLLQEFQGIVTYDQHIVAYLELMRQPYTGCNPRGLMLARDAAAATGCRRSSPTRCSSNRRRRTHRWASPRPPSWRTGPV